MSKVNQNKNEQFSFLDRFPSLTEEELASITGGINKLYYKAGRIAATGFKYELALGGCLLGVAALL